MELLVPGNDLLQIALGNKKMPATAKGRIELFIRTALDFMPGGKLMRLFKSTAVRKVQGHILKLASKAGKKAGNSIKFFDAKELAKRLGTDQRTFHEVIKKDIKKSFKNLLDPHNIKNPDIGVDNLGNIVLRDVRTGTTLSTNIPLSE